MIHTLNEVYRLCQKAAEGAGAPAGVDIETARSTAWLAGRGFTDVLEGLHRELERIDGGRANVYEFSQEDLAADKLDATARPGALLAAGLAGLLVARAQDRSARLKAGGLTSPLYLLPAAAFYCQGDWHFLFELRSRQDHCFALMANPDGAQVLGQPGTRIGELSSDDVFELDAQVSRQALAPTASGSTQLETLASADDLEKARAQTLAHGVEVDKKAWQALEVYAHRVLVPATAESRARGAG